MVDYCKISHYSLYNLKLHCGHLSLITLFTFDCYLKSKIVSDRIRTKKKIRKKTHLIEKLATQQK